MVTDEPLATAEGVRSELEVSQSEYPSEEDDGVDKRGLVDKWIDRAHIVVEKRLPASISRTLQRQVEVLVAAHFGYPSTSGSVDGESVSSISQGGRTINFDMNDVPGDDGSTPFWQRAVDLDRRLVRDYWTIQT